MLFFNLEGSLFNRLVEQHIKNWLDLNIIIKKVIILNLSNLINSSFLRDVFWRWWFRLENICLQFHFCFIRFRLALFSQEVCEINLDPCRWAWSQVVGTGCILGFLEFHQLGFYHLDLLPFSFFFDALLFFLRGIQILLQDVLVVSVSSEHSLVVHNIEGLTTFLFLGDWRV